MQKFWEIYKTFIAGLLVTLVLAAALLGYLTLLIEVLPFWWSMFVLLGITPAIIAGVLAYVGRDND